MPLWITIICALLTAAVVGAIGYGAKLTFQTAGLPFTLGFLSCFICVFVLYHLGKWIDRKDAERNRD